jgi:hypothetical protein
MSKGPLREAIKLPFHDPFGVGACIIAQILYMFNQDGAVPDLDEIDRALGREQGEPIAIEPGIDYLLRQGFTVRTTSTYNRERFVGLSVRGAQEYLRSFYDDRVDGVEEYFEVVITLDHVAELQRRTAQALVDWQRYDYRWIEGTPTVADVAAAMNNGNVVDTFAFSGKPVRAGALVVKYYEAAEAFAGPTFKLYGLNNGGVLMYCPADQFPKEVDLSMGLTAIIR